MTKFYICSHCKSIVLKLNDLGPSPSCCGEEMKELIPNTVEASFEKHIPFVEQDGNKVHVEVGEVIHPMLKEHYIEWIYLPTNKGAMIKYLQPGEEPKADFVLAEGEIALSIYAYCNLHGLWKKDL